MPECSALFEQIIDTLKFMLLSRDMPFFPPGSPFLDGSAGKAMSHHDHLRHSLVMLTKEYAACPTALVCQLAKNFPQPVQW